MRILITSDYLTPGDAVDRLLHDGGHHTVHSPATGARRDGELSELLADADAAMVASEAITAAMLDEAPSLRVIARTGVGYETIDVDAATSRRVYVCNTPGANRYAVAEMTLTLLLMCARRIGETLTGVRAGHWPRHDSAELRGATLGLVGLGQSGRAVADLAHAFGMKILVATAYPDPALRDRYDISFVSRDELLANADYVTLHVRPTPANTHLIDVRAFEMMKATAYLVNTARGSLVDESALIDALRERWISGAAIDVVETEPLPLDSPLRELDHLVITSHLAGQTRQARKTASQTAAHDVLRVLTGQKPCHAVNGEALTATPARPAAASQRGRST